MYFFGWLFLEKYNLAIPIHNIPMSKKIKTEFHELSSLLNFKEDLWLVCKSLFTIKEDVYYERLSLFKHFAVFKDGDKVVGFLSFFVDEVFLDSKSAVLMGIGHGALLPEYRNQQLLPKATIKFSSKLILQNPLKHHFIWGMATTHLSYRMGLRGTKVQYPSLDGNCPPFCRNLLNWAGNKYYKKTYDSSTFTATIGFSATGQGIFPSDKEMEDPIVASFIRRVPSALAPNNKTGAFSITPVGPNVGFWVKKFLFGKQPKRKNELNV
jgi:hypothetical protein